MASIVNEDNGRKRIEFIGTDGKRRRVRLGKATVSQAERFKAKVQDLVTASITGRMEDDTARWVASQGVTMRKKLERAGLIRAGDGRENSTLKTLLDEFFAALTVKPGTETTYKQTRKSLETHFGEGCVVRELGPLEAEKWRQAMRAEKLAEATISKRVKTARQIFKQAVRWGMASANPFADVKAGSQANRERMYFLSRADAQRLLDACPDAQWRLLVALSRFGGLRCPSEHLALRWGDVDWDRGTIRVRSPKTEGHEGGDSRLLPMFPELRKALDSVAMELGYTQGPNEPVITRYRDNNSNLRTQFRRIIKRAGLTPWPKLFHNLRSTRQTELAERFPIHVVCAWLGNSQAVAQAHYLQVTDAHFAQAVTAAGEGAEQAAQNPAQHPLADARSTSQTPLPEMQKRPEIPSVSVFCESLRDSVVTPMGFEPMSPP